MSSQSSISKDDILKELSVLGFRNVDYKGNNDYPFVYRDFDDSQETIGGSIKHPVIAFYRYDDSSWKYAINFDKGEFMVRGFDGAWIYSKPMPISDFMVLYK